MKTFKQWFDSRSEATKQYILKECGSWIDTSTPDYYKAQKKSLSIEDITGEDSEWYSRSCLAMYILSQNSKATVDDYIDYYKNHEYRNVDFQSLEFLTVEDRKRVMRKLCFQKSETAEFEQWLFCIDDYGDIANHASQLSFSRDGVNDTLIDMFGEEFAINYTRLHPEIITFSNMPTGSRSIMFDTLFYGDNGWSEAQKNELMKRWSQDIRWHCGRYSQDDKLEAMRKVMYHVGMVRKSDLKYIYRFIQEMPELAQHLYDMKKPDSELTGTESRDMQYRFPVWLRKLFLIMGCCARGNISTANTQKLQKEGASLLRMYNFDFNAYFDAYLQQSPNF